MYVNAFHITEDRIRKARRQVGMLNKFTFCGAARPPSAGALLFGEFRHRRPGHRQQGLRRGCKDVARRPGSGPHHIEIQKPRVEEAADRGEVAQGGHAADGKAGFRADQVGFGLAEPLSGDGAASQDDARGQWGSSTLTGTAWRSDRCTLEPSWASAIVTLRTGSCRGART